jgi:uncharacterized membrane protein required for colicin V production
MNALALLEDRSPIPWIDITLLVCLLGGVYLGARRGIWWQLVRLLGVIATLALARAVAPRIAPGLNSYVESMSPQMANGIMWGCILILGLSIVTLVGRIGKAALEGAEFSPLDRVGGGALGALSMALVFTGAVIVAAQVATPEWNNQHLRPTRTQSMVDTLARRIPQALDPLAAERTVPQVWAADAQR